MELPRTLTESELSVVDTFRHAAEKIAAANGVKDNFNIYNVADEANISIQSLPKDGILIQAIWVAFLSVMKAHYPSEDFKYPSVSSFLEAYAGEFDEYSEEEQINLWETANWMSILFLLIPAKKNKGLAIAIVPKLVEGWMTKYVTGSGQKRATADRVRIFETEGNVKPNQRGKVKPAKRCSSSDPGGAMLARLFRKPAGRKMRDGRCTSKRRRAAYMVSKSAMLSSSSDASRKIYDAHDTRSSSQFAEVQEEGRMEREREHPAGLDLTDTDHDSSEDYMGMRESDCSTQDLDLETNLDFYFNKYQEGMLMSLEMPEAQASREEDGDEADLLGGMDIDNDEDYFEVLRLLSEPTPVLRHSSSSTLSLSRMSASPRMGFTTPTNAPFSPRCLSPMAMNMAPRSPSFIGLPTQRAGV